jgi:5-methylcytosine-specific restriction protein A
MRRPLPLDDEPQKAESRIDWNPEDLPPSGVPLTIVCGAPASGKSTYVARRAAPGDVVIDLDTIGAELSGEGNRIWDRRRWLGPAIARRNHLLRLLAARTEGAAWFIVGAPAAEDRERWAHQLRPIEVVVIETPQEVCFARVDADPFRRRQRMEQQDAIYRRWLYYTPRAGETVVR